MSKVVWKPGTMVYPVPAVMVSCGNEDDGYNIITIAWTGTICTDPAMAYISVRPDRYSYDLIKKSGDFVINLTTKELAKATDWCGVRSGRDYDKFKEMELTPVKANKVSSPLIEECPINIECKVTEIKELGSHHMFLAEVVAVNASEKYLNEKTGSFDMAKAGLISFIHGKYYGSTAPLGKFGYSIQKMRPETRRAEQVAMQAKRAKTKDNLAPETRRTEQVAMQAKRAKTKDNLAPETHEVRYSGLNKKCEPASNCQTEPSSGRTSVEQVSSMTHANETHRIKSKKPRWTAKQKSASRKKKNRKK